MRRFLSRASAAAIATVRPRVSSTVVGSASIRAQSNKNKAPVFRGHYIAKPDGCMALRVQPPKYKREAVEFPKTSRWNLSSQGSVVLDFAPLAAHRESAGSSSGSTKYDWLAKNTFALYPTHIIQLLSFTPAQLELRLTHESKVKEGSATSVRSLTIKPANDNKSVTFTAEGSASAPTTIELTIVEFQLLKTQLGVSIPWLTGWQQLLDPSSFTDQNIHREWQPPSSPAGSASSAAGEDG